MVPKQERSRRTRDRILDAAAAEFAEHGYADANLQRVAERTGLTKGAIYGHFGSKREIAVVLVEQLREALSGLPAAPAPPGRPGAAEGARPVGPLGELGVLVCGVAERIDRDVRFRAAVRLADEDARAGGGPSPLLDALRGAALRLVRRAQQEGGVPGRVPPEPLADLAVASFYGAWQTTSDWSGAELPQRVRGMWEALTLLAAERRC